MVKKAVVPVRTRRKSSEKKAGATVAEKRKIAPEASRLYTSECFINRELSWLDFNARVLELASNASIPLLERVKFLAIFSSNLDEFYMVRVAGLLEQVRTHTRETDPSGHSPAQLLDLISRRVRELCGLQSRLWLQDLHPALAAAGIEVVPRSEVSDEETRQLKKYFQKMVQPVLTPLAIDPAHPFPHLPNRSICLCVKLRHTSRSVSPVADGGRERYAFVEVPQILPRFVPLARRAGRYRFVLLRDVIGMFLSLVFPGAEIVDSYVTRLTRDSDLDLDEEEAEDLLKVIEKELRQRKWGNAVRVEVSSRAPADVQQFLMDSLDIQHRDLIPIEGPVNYGDFFFLSSLAGFDHLRYTPFTAQLRPVWTEERSIFETIREQDRLVHHPYESFHPVVEFIDSAANDPDVLAIKMTLYRTSADSPLVRSLIKAAGNGKQVVALVELKARFDEANNIQWARQLERGGVHVVYGIVGLKTHCKAVLVVRREGKSLRRYAHLATGNYNPQTATLYTDLGLFTADERVCEDVGDMFNMLTGFAQPGQWREIVTSPNGIHDRLRELIRAEAELARQGKPARIVCKMNALVDPTMVRELYDASAAGVKIQLIVRSVCCLRPGVTGLSENIRVQSIVGRFLEHSRVFVFGAGPQPRIYISSADWMQRNFFSRVEIMIPIHDEEARRRILEEVLEYAMQDTANSWDLRQDNSWKHRPHTQQSVDLHAKLVELESGAVQKKSKSAPTSTVAPAKKHHRKKAA